MILARRLPGLQVLDLTDVGSLGPSELAETYGPGERPPALVLVPRLVRAERVRAVGAGPRAIVRVLDDDPGNDPADFDLVGDWPDEDLDGVGNWPFVRLDMGWRWYWNRTGQPPDRFDDLIVAELTKILPQRAMAAQLV